MPALQWLGTLEPRPSPLVQALNALQPGVDALAEWLRQQPERERQMLQTTAEFLWSLPAEVRENMLRQITPERAAMLVEMSQRHGGLGGFGLAPEGHLTMAVPLKVEEEQRKVELQRISDALAPLRVASPERRRALEGLPEVQQVLQRAAQLWPGIAAPDETGVYRVTEDFDQALDRLAKQAGIEETRAGAALKMAQAEAIPRELALRARELGLQEQDIKNRYDIALRQIEQRRDEFEKELGLRREEFEQRKYEFAQNLAIARMEFEFNKTKWAQQLGLSERELGLRRDEIEKNYTLATMQFEQRKYEFAQTLRLQLQEFEQRKYEFAQNYALAEERLKHEKKKWADQLGLSQRELDLQERKIANDYAIALMDLDFRKEQWAQQFGLSVQEFEQRKHEFAETLALERYKAERMLDLRAEELGIEREESKARIAQAMAHTELLKQQARDIPLSRALQEAVAQHNMSMDEARVFLQLYEIEAQERMAKADRALRREIANMQNDVERERNRIMRENNLLDYDLGTLQALIGIDEWAALSVLEERRDLTEEQKALIEKGIKQKRTRDAIALSAEIVNQVLSTPALATAVSEYVKRQGGQFDPFSLIMSFAQDIAGDLWDGDEAVRVTSGIPLGIEPGEQSGWADTLLSFIAGGFAAKWGGKLVGKARDAVKSTVSRLRGTSSSGATSPVVRALQSGPVQQGLPGIGEAQPLPGPSASGKAIPMGNVPGAVQLPETDPATGARTVTLPSKLQPGKIPKGTQFVRLQAPIWIPSEEEFVEMGLLPREQYELERQGRAALWDYFTTWLKSKLGLATSEGVERSRQQLSAVLEALRGTGTGGNTR